MEALTFFDLPESAYRRKRCVVCGGSLSQRTGGYTYIMRRQNWLKIGYSNEPARRLKELARPEWASKYIVMPERMDVNRQLLLSAAFAGDDEHAWHQMWRDFHDVGEWFHLFGSAGMVTGEFYDWYHELIRWTDYQSASWPVPDLDDNLDAEDARLFVVSESWRDGVIPARSEPVVVLSSTYMALVASDREGTQDGDRLTRDVS